MIAAESNFAVEAAAGYAFNKKFHGPTASIKGKYDLAPISSKLSHGISLEVMAGMSKAKKSGELTPLVAGAPASKAGARHMNEVKVTQMPILLNYHLSYALDSDSKWKLDASVGAGMQYFCADQTNKHEIMLADKPADLKTKDKAGENVYAKYFGTDTGSNKFKKKSWKPVGKLALGVSYNTEKWSAFVRGFALISKSSTFTTPVPNAKKPTVDAKIAPATLKWGGVQFGAEAGIGIKF